MDLAMLYRKFSKETDHIELQKCLFLLVKCLQHDSKGCGYCVMNDHNPQNTLYEGSREQCVAFIEGYKAAPLTDVGCFDDSVLCVCGDTPSRMIVIPEERFGEELGEENP